MTNIPVGVELTYADRWSDRHDEANRRFSRLNANEPKNLCLADRKHTAFPLQNQLTVFRITNETNSTNEACRDYGVYDRTTAL
jgi:hypothetical protein